jgi:hypothetical protein
MLEENFRNKIISAISENDEKKKKSIFSSLFQYSERIIASTETKMLHQQKALDLSYLEPEGQGSGSIMGVPRPFGAKSIFC